MSDLDSFFAKRDKKKSVVGKAIKPAEVNTIAPEGDIDGTTCETRRKIDATKDEEDDDWKSFDSEEKKDYTGLKIQPLILPDVDENESDGTTDEKPKSRGPWKMDVPIETDKSSPLEVKSMPAIYVHPQERVIQRTSEVTSSHDPPDMKSTLVFPSLYEAGKVGLRSNQSVWNRTPPVQEGRMQTQSVQVCRLEKSTPEEARRFVARRQNIDTRDQSSWRKPQIHEDKVEKTERPSTNENWRSKQERSTNESQRGSWRKPNLVDNCEEKSSHGEKGSIISPAAETPKVARYIPPNLRQKLAT